MMTGINTIDKHHVLEKCISHESKLITVRLLWSLAFQGLLFLAYIVACKMGTFFYTTYAIAMLGMLSSAIPNLRIYTANCTIEEAKSEWGIRKQREFLFSKGSRRTSLFGRFYSHLFLTFSTLCWIGIVVFEIIKFCYGQSF